MKTAVKISFDYPPAAVAQTKEFFVYQVDPKTHIRNPKNALLTIPIKSIPTAAHPATVSVNGSGKQTLQVTAFDGHTEGDPAYLDVTLNGREDN